jgi:hypothetical protein
MRDVATATTVALNLAIPLALSCKRCTRSLKPAKVSAASFGIKDLDCGWHDTLLC